MKMKNFLLVAITLIGTNSLFAQIHIGEKAPSFNLKNIDGKMVSLSDYNDQKGVVVIFTCNHCPYAKLYESRIKSIHTKYSPLNIPVVAINPNDSTISPQDSYSKMIENAKTKGFSFPYILDDVGVFKKYGATKTPHVFLLKKENNYFVVTYIGAIDDNAQDSSDVGTHYLTNAMDHLLKNENPEITLTKSVGCTIKTK